MKPSLEGAYARIVRANDHLERLKFDQPTFTAHETDWQPDAYGPLALREAEVLPVIIGILVGEVVYNLRAALDYLIYELALLDSGSVQDGTQFPIEDTPAGFIERKRYIRNLSGPHQTAIEALQPYMGCNWMKVLRTISNPDKHRRLTVIRRMLKREAVTLTGSGPGMRVQSDVTLGISFDDGSFVIETLEILQAEVRSAIDVFNPEFKV